MQSVFMAHIVISFLKNVQDEEEGEEEGTSWCYTFGEERNDIKKKSHHEHFDSQKTLPIVLWRIGG